MKKYEYVFSAPAMLRLQRSHHLSKDSEEKEVHKTLLCNAITELKNRLSMFDVSLLFNAFTEESFSEWIIGNDNYGLSNVFVDSGGLQMVTRGLEIDDEKKRKIYEVQSRHDFAMCFDVIPCKNREDIVVSASNRVNASTKIFYPELLEECAIETANNIKRQIEYFDSVDSSTKVFYIIQGNTYEDMLKWFEYGMKVLEPSHFKNIAGLALADTCIGNGKIETAEMMIAYSEIMKDPILKDCNRVHLLGVGSIGRVYPVILVDSIIPTEVIISMDSTSFSKSFIFGTFSIGSKSIKISDSRVSRMIHDAITLFFESNRDYDSIRGDMSDCHKHIIQNQKSLATILDDSNFESKRDKTIILALISFILIYQIYSFDRELKLCIEKSKTDVTPEGLLRRVRGYDDFLHWKLNYEKYLTSNRIVRANEYVSLEKFF